MGYLGEAVLEWGMAVHLMRIKSIAPNIKWWVVWCS